MIKKNGNLQIDQMLSIHSMSFECFEFIAVS